MSSSNHEVSKKQVHVGEYNVMTYSYGTGNNVSIATSRRTRLPFQLFIRKP